MTTVDRRSFLKAGGVTAGATLLGGTGLQAISMRMAEAAPGKGTGRRRNAAAGYGPISPTRVVNTRDSWLALPEGFEYSVFSTTGSPMSDGRLAPRSHDGMGAFGSTAGVVTLIRNQEIRFNRGPQFSQGEFTIEPADNAYDRTAEGAPPRCASTPASSARAAAASRRTS